MCWCLLGTTECFALLWYHSQHSVDVLELMDLIHAVCPLSSLLIFFNVALGCNITPSSFIHLSVPYFIPIKNLRWFTGINEIK
jgi:hypothetical protein